MSRAVTWSVSLIFQQKTIPKKKRVSVKRWLTVRDVTVSNVLQRWFWEEDYGHFTVAFYNTYRYIKKIKINNPFIQFTQKSTIIAQCCKHRDAVHLLSASMFDAYLASRTFSDQPRSLPLRKYDVLFVLLWISADLGQTVRSPVFGEDSAVATSAVTNELCVSSLAFTGQEPDCCTVPLGTCYRQGFE